MKNRFETFYFELEMSKPNHIRHTREESPLNQKRAPSRDPAWQNEQSIIVRARLNAFLLEEQEEG